MSAAKGPVALRPARAGDAGAILAVYIPYVETATATVEYTPPTAEEMGRRMAAREGLFPWLVAEDAAGVLLGYAYASRYGARPGYNWVCETSIYVDQNTQHRGLGRALYTALLQLLAAQGYRAAVGILTVPNPASERFHQSLGFVRQGLLEDINYKFGRPLSLGYYVKRLHPAVESPPLPLPFSALDEGLVRECLRAAAHGMGASSK